MHLSEQNTAGTSANDRPALDLSFATGEELEHAFMAWWKENAHAWELGGLGDLHDLALRLSAALANSCNRSAGI